MPLSEYEQRVLDQLERELGADSALGQALGKTTPSRSRGRMTWAVLGVIVGLGVVLTGAVTQSLWVGITGFALMTFAALWGMLAPSTPRTQGGTRGSAGPSRPARPSSAGGVRRRAEERFERRREQGDL